MPADGDQQEEWTRVKSKSRSRKGPRNEPATPTSHPPSSAETHSTKPAAEIEAEYEIFKTRWQDSDAYPRLKELISANIESCQPLRKAICLGIGTFDPEHGGWDAKRRTYVQLLGFLTMIEQLSKSSEAPIECIFQEPRFSPGDKEFIRKLGHQVVETPAAFEAVDENTLLFAVHMYRPIYELALEKTLPAAFVGTGWDTWDDVGNLKEDDFTCMREMHASHRLMPFPQDGTHTTFSSTCLHWKPRSEEADQAAEKPSSKEVSINEQETGSATKSTPTDDIVSNTKAPTSASRPKEDTCSTASK